MLFSSSPLRRLLPLALLATVPVTLLSACSPAGSAQVSERAPAVVQPGAPGEPGQVLTDDKVPQPEGQLYTEADVRFMQGMVLHHAQALVMAGMVPARTTRKDLTLLAERIKVSQEDEITLIQHWLQARLKQVPNGTSGHTHGGDLMPGMLTDEQLAELKKATGTEFDKLFVKFMIYHHTGALGMVEKLFADNGGQEPETYQFATHVDADQRIEIDRMRQLQAEMRDTSE
ncbi:DUF305 domain-containing protein [Sphaerisporangium sp. NPDC088356]|uniref:DUF305 domain-containing protein n=1 Tax=Sphaerisporangium sp. NPDC088356 TaxID=3154871 RepID=UPI003427BBF3